MARRGGGGKAEERRSKAHATRAALSDRSASDLSSDAGPAVSDESSGSDSNEQRSRWRDELFVALKRGHTPHVRRLLLAHGYPVNDPLFATGSAESGITVRGAATALHVAAWAGQAPMCRWLLRHGADPHARDGLHMTPAETATSAEVLRVLSRARKYRQQFRQATANVSSDQRLEALELAVRRLQFGDKVPTPVLVRTHDSGPSDFEERLSELRRLVRDYNANVNQRVDTCEEEVATVRRLLESLRGSEDRFQGLLKDVRLDLDRLRLVVNELSRAHACTRCSVWALAVAMVLCVAGATIALLFVNGTL